MSEADLMEHLTSIQALTFEQGMDIYKNMRIIRGKVSTLIAYFRLQPKEETEVRLVSEDGKVSQPRDYDSLAAALLAVPGLNAREVLINSLGGSFKITRID